MNQNKNTGGRIMTFSEKIKFSEQLKQVTADRFLLLHPFYKAWERGEVPLKALQEYAAQYYRHVQAFPRYISAAHSLCEGAESRRILLENLADEEGLSGGEPHPELWLRFAEGLDLSREEVQNAAPRESIKNVIHQFLKASRSSYAEGLASLYTYERQVPEVASTKIKGLKEHYGVNDERALSFFTVHEKADIYHREACEKLLDDLPESDRPSAEAAAEKSAQVLWDFLSDMQSCADSV